MEREIRLQETRNVDGLDRDIPTILADGAIYDPHLDRFFLELPLNGTRSRHSLRAVGYDIVVWLRFLEQARTTSVWSVSHDDVVAFHGTRRRRGASHRISASTWNRSVASLDKLYRWGVDRELIAASPFRHRQVWKRGIAGRRSAQTERNMAYEPSAASSHPHFASLETYRLFNRLGLRGLMRRGHERPGARDRNGTRNALFADLLVSTGLRLEEAGSLLACEVDAEDIGEGSPRQIRFALPPPVSKGNRGRTILIPRRIIARLQDYIEIERASAIAKFKARSVWTRTTRPIFVERSEGNPTMLTLPDGSSARIDRFDPEERQRLVLCKAGVPYAPAALWLSEIGLPVRFNSWEAIFLRASRRCSDMGLDIRLSPHQLRHTFAVHMLAMLIEQQIGHTVHDVSGMEAYRQLLSDPLQQVQRLLGHASITTTYVYLDQIAAQADTVDTAVERLLALVSDGDVL
ncbi:tyrosine-type recombinase/integrase [Sedimentitalea sp. HM32M-2]|uniref:tyrosine-type recombinase/integrase n=1 Tax=Sedimentitalea sp. HM32M-2 TaxID=3351566 RepID=UPI003642D7E2